MRRFLSLLLLLCLGAAVLVVVMWRDKDTGEVVEADIGKAHFAFALGYARDDATANGGSTNRLAFAASFPDFTPLSRADRALSLKPQGERGRRALLITVSQKEETVDPADRPSRLYARFLEGDAWSGPGGLVLRRFEQGSPYDLEQLYIAPPDGRSFFARCPKAQGAPATPDTCMSIFRMGALDVELRYAPALLEHWEALYDGARGLLERMTAAGKREKR